MNKQNMSFEDAKEDVIDFLYRTRADAKSELELRNKRSLESKSIMNKVKSELSKDYKLVSESENTLYFKAPDNSTHDDCIAFVDKVVAVSGGKYKFTGRGGSWTQWDILTPGGSYIKAGYDYSNEDNYAVYFKSILIESRSTKSTSKVSVKDTLEVVDKSLKESLNLNEAKNIINVLNKNLRVRFKHSAGGIFSLDRTPFNEDTFSKLIKNNYKMIGDILEEQGLKYDISEDAYISKDTNLYVTIYGDTSTVIVQFDEMESESLNEDTQLSLFDDDMINDIEVLYMWRPEEVERILIKHGSDKNNDNWVDGLDVPAAYDEIMSTFKDKYSDDDEIDYDVAKVLGLEKVDESLTEGKDSVSKDDRDDIIFRLRKLSTEASEALRKYESLGNLEECRDILYYLVNDSRRLLDFVNDLLVSRKSESLKEDVSETPSYEAVGVKEMPDGTYELQCIDHSYNDEEFTKYIGRPGTPTAKKNASLFFRDKTLYFKDKELEDHIKSMFLEECTQPSNIGQYKVDDKLDMFN